MEEYDYIVEYKKGSENTAADELSRVHITQDNTNEPQEKETGFKFIIRLRIKITGDQNY